MVRSAEANEQKAKIAELKRLITSRKFESLEMLEDAVDACLWGKDDASAAYRGKDHACCRDHGARRQTV